MESTGRFLLGGALGAALGYLLSQKDQEKTQEAGQQSLTPASAGEAATPTWSVTPVATVPLGSAPPAAPTPPAPAEPEIVLTRDFLEEPLPGAGWSPSVPSAVEDETVETVPEATPTFEAPQAGSETDFQVESVMIDEVMEVPPVEEVAEVPAAEALMEEAPAVEAPMPQTTPVDAQVTEEKPSQTMGPGSAGTDALAQAATVAGSIPTVEASSTLDSARVDDLKSRIEETRRRIRRELEQPFDDSSFAGSFGGDWTIAPAVPVAEEVEVPPVVVEPEAAESPVEFEPPVAAEAPVTSETPIVAEPVAAEAPAVEEAAIVENPTLETVEVEALAAESVTAEPPVTAGPEVAEPPVAAGPLLTPEQPLAPERPVVPGPPIMEPPTAQPAAEVEAPAPAGAAIDLENAVSDADVTAEAVMEPVDYDSMKSRIESTRSRLKAKAFDAMMTGESALLGRDVGGVPGDRGKVSGVDDEVDETIETSLREEEE